MHAFTGSGYEDLEGTPGLLEAFRWHSGGIQVAFFVDKVDDNKYVNK